MKLLWSFAVLSCSMVACKTSSTNTGAVGQLESISISKDVKVDWICNDTALIYRDNAESLVILKTESSSLQFKGEGDLVSSTGSLKVRDLESDSYALTFERKGQIVTGTSSKDDTKFNCTPAGTTAWNTFVGNGNAIKCREMNGANLDVVIKKTDGNYAVTKLENGSAVPFTGLARSKSEKGFVFGTTSTPKIFELIVSPEIPTYAGILTEGGKQTTVSCVGSLSMLN